MEWKGNGMKRNENGMKRNEKPHMWNLKNKIKWHSDL